MSLYTNLFIIGIASDQLAGLFPSLFTRPPALSTRWWWRRSGSRPHGDTDIAAGKGRYVVLLCVAVEHALLLLLLASEYLIARPPAWVRHVLARRAHEKAESRLSLTAPTAVASSERQRRVE